MALAYYMGRKRSLNLVSGRVRDLHSLPSYYGIQTALWCGVPALLLFVLWVSFEGSVVTGMVVDSLPQEIQELPPQRLDLVVNDIRNLAQGNIVSQSVGETMQRAADHYASLMKISDMALFVIALSVAIAGGLLAQRSINRQQRARNRVEKAINFFLISSSSLAIFTTIGIVFSVLFESIRFFQQIPVTEFLFGLEWSPQTAIRADQVGSSGVFGAIPLFAGTFLITLIAMFVAVPIGLMSAIYMAEYASKHFRALAKPVLEILAGIPTVVYGFFAALTVAPFFRDMGATLGLGVSSESALAAGVVMGIMIIPFVSSLSDDVINAVPQAMRDGSYGLGATRSETIRQVIIPAALPGIVGGVLLAVSRAIGETMIVVMAAGLSANLTANPLEAVTTVTVQIVTLLVGDQEFDSAKTLAAFALALVLFVITLSLNMIALHIVRKYREQYE
jgi:phosphate transport system permease protein